MIAKSWFLLVLVLGIILFGSLYPFAFHFAGGNADAVRHLLVSWRQLPPSRSDAIANVLFYAPYGFTFVQTFNSTKSATFLVVAAAATGIALSTTMELLQFYDADRDCSLSDVYLNGTGALFGAFAAAAWGQQLCSIRLLEKDRSTFAFLILLAWLGWRLYPYEPTIDLHKYWMSVKPAFLAPSLDAYGIFRYAIMWTGMAYVAQYGLKLRHPRLTIPLAIAAVLVAKILIVELWISRPEIFGALTALLYLSFVLERHVLVGTRILAALFLFAIVLGRMLPLELTTTPHAFEWLPFFSFLHGSLGVNLQSFLQKCFVYGTGLSLLINSGLSLGWAASLECGLLFATSLVETHIVGRSGEITDALMAVLIAVVYALTDTAARKSRLKATGS